MRLNGASIVGSDADQYRLAGDDCTDVTLASGEHCAVQVKFAPDSRGQATGRLRISGDGGSFSSSLAGTGVAKANVGVRFQWRKALRPQGARLVAGKAACHLASGCKLKASAILLTKVHRGTAVRHLAVKLPRIRMTIGGGTTRALSLRLTKAARAAAQERGTPSARPRLERGRPPRTHQLEAPARCVALLGLSGLRRFRSARSSAMGMTRVMWSSPSSSALLPRSP